MATFIPRPAGSCQQGRDSVCEFEQLLLLDKLGTCYIYQIAFSPLVSIGWGFPFLRVPLERPAWPALFLEAVKLVLRESTRWEHLSSAELADLPTSFEVRLLMKAGQCARQSLHGIFHCRSANQF